MSSLRKIGFLGLVFCLLFCSAETGFAREKEPAGVVKSWRLLYDYGQADTIGLDTGYLNLPMRTHIWRNSVANAYNGNIVSPLQSKLYFDRDGNGLRNGLPRPKLEFIFGQTYSPYIITPFDVKYYNTNMAYSGVSYEKGFKTYHEESDIHFHFTGNIRKDLNLGMELNYLNSPGQYQNQAGKLFNGDVFGSYDGKHYGLRAAVTFNTLSNFENGGLDTPEELGGIIAAADMPVNLNAMSGFKHISGYLNHHYSICVEREEKRTIPQGPGKEPIDTFETVYVPVTTFTHTFSTTNSVKRYIEKTAGQGFYDDIHINKSATNDSTNVLAIRNTLAVTFEEAFNKWLRFGATVYATNECLRYQYGINRNFPLSEQQFDNSWKDLLGQQLVGLTDTVMGTKWTNNTMVGGSIYKNEGRYIHYGVNGDVCLVGYKMGEFQVNGHISSDFPIGKDSMHIVAQAYVRNEEPDYYLQHYRSNHYIWNNDFKKVYRFFVGGHISYPTQWVKPEVRVGFENLTNSIYFGPDGRPVQHNGNVQVLEVNAKLDLTTPWVNLENNVIYQMASDSTIPLPAITLYHNLYYHGCWFKALDAQMGVDMRFHTKYYAPLYNPATGQFCMQNEQKIGGYPVLNVYANFYVRSLKLKLFVQFCHFNYYFMKHKTYFTMPGYAENPAMFKAGAAWHFWR